MNPILRKFYTNITLLLIYHLIQGQNHCHLHSFHYLDPPPPHHHHHYHRQQQNCPLPLLPLPPHLPQILHHCFQLLFLSDPHLLHLRDWKCNKWVGIMDTNRWMLSKLGLLHGEWRAELVKIYRRLLPFPHIQSTPSPIFPFDHPSKSRTAVIIFTKKSTEHLLIKITPALQTTLLAAKGNLPPFSACYQELFALQQLACCVYCLNSWNRLKRCWETSF